MADEVKKMVVPKDVADQVRAYAQNHNCDFKDLADRLREFYYGPCVQFKEEDGTRARQSMLALKAILNSGRSGGQEMEGIVLHMTYPEPVVAKKDTDKEKIMHRANIIGIFKTGENDKKVAIRELIKLSAWDEAIEIIKKMPMNVVVRIKDIQVTENQEYGKQYNINRTSTFVVVDKEEKNVTKLIMSLYPKSLVDITEIEMKPSKNPQDKKLVKARVRESSVFVSKKGKILARYSVYNDDISDEDLKEDPDENTTTIMCDAALGKYGPGSLCYFLGNISPTTKEYSASMFADLVIPIMKIEKSADVLTAEFKNAEARKVYYSSEEYQQKKGTAQPAKKGSKTVHKEEEKDDDLDDVTSDVDLSSWDK